jgi:hypothetical protein
MITSIFQFSPFSRSVLARMFVVLTSAVLAVFIVSDLSSHSANVSRRANSAAPTPAAATYTVNSVSDVGDTNVGDGHCDTDGNLANGDQCTLRAAIQEGAFSNQGHSINFNLPAGSVITLSTALPSFEHYRSGLKPANHSAQYRGWHAELPHLCLSADQRQFHKLHIGTDDRKRNQH